MSKNGSPKLARIEKQSNYPEIAPLTENSISKVYRHYFQLNMETNFNEGRIYVV